MVGKGRGFGCFAAACLAAALQAPRGQSLERLPKPYPNFAPNWVAVDGLGVITAAGDGSGYYQDPKDPSKKTTGRGFYWSADQGNTWTGDSSRTSVTATYDGEAIKPDPNTSNPYSKRYKFVAGPDGDLFALQVIVAADKISRISTVFRSTDHGFTWKNTCDSLPVNDADPIYFDLLVAPNGHLFLWCFKSSSQGYVRGLYVSKDKGANWEQKTDPTGAANASSLNRYVACVADPESQLFCEVQRANSSNNLHSLVLRSRDEGATWDSLPAQKAPGAFIKANRKGMFVDLGGCPVEVFYHQEAGSSAADSSLCGGGTFGGGAYTSDVALTEDGGVLAAAAYMGVVAWDNALKTKTSLNAGMGTDSASGTRFLTDADGDIFAWTGPSLFRYVPGSTGIRAWEKAIPIRPASAPCDALGRKGDGNRAGRPATKRFFRRTRQG